MIGGEEQLMGDIANSKLRGEEWELEIINYDFCYFPTLLFLPLYKKRT